MEHIGMDVHKRESEELEVLYLALLPSLRIAITAQADARPTRWPLRSKSHLSRNPLVSHNVGWSTGGTSGLEAVGATLEWSVRFNAGHRYGHRICYLGLCRPPDQGVDGHGYIACPVSPD